LTETCLWIAAFVFISSAAKMGSKDEICHQRGTENFIVHDGRSAPLVKRAVGYLKADHKIRNIVYPLGSGYCSVSSS